MKIKIFFLVLGIIGGAVVTFAAAKPKLDQLKLLTQQQYPPLPSKVDQHMGVIEEVGPDYVKAWFHVQVAQFPTKEKPDNYERKHIKLLVGKDTQVMQGDTSDPHKPLEEITKTPITLAKLKVGGHIIAKIDGNFLDPITEAKAIFIWYFE